MNLLITLLKVKNKHVSCLQPCLSVCHWQPWLIATAQDHQRVLYYLSLARGKDQNSKFNGQFLLNVFHFHSTIKLKNPKSNHSKSRTMCIHSPTFQSLATVGALY